MSEVPLYFPGQCQPSRGHRGGGHPPISVTFPGSVSSGSEAGSYLRLRDSCITQIKAQGPSRTCDESEQERERAVSAFAGTSWWGAPASFPLLLKLTEVPLLLSDVPLSTSVAVGSTLTRRSTLDFCLGGPHSTCSMHGTLAACAPSDGSATARASVET